MKTCKKCSIEKEFNEFYKGKRGKDGCRAICKKCINTITRDKRKNNPKETKRKDRIYYNNIKEKAQKASRKYYKNNKERKSKNNKQYYVDNKKDLSIKKLKYENEKYKSNFLFRLKKILRTATYEILKRRSLTTKNSSLHFLGCTIEEFIQYIEKQFILNMNWENYGKIWHLDHIKPLAMAKKEQDLYELCHYTNLQPLLVEENLKKSSIYNGKRYCKKRNPATNTE